jgi:hypothetical protein
MTHIVGSGSKNPTDRVFFQNGATPLATNAFDSASTASSDRGWSSPTFDVSSQMPGTDPNDGFGEKVTTTSDHTSTTPNDCLAWSAIIFSTTVADTDADGQPDKLEETNNMKLPDGTPLPDLKAMGATKNHKDVFLELGALYADPGTTYGVGPAAVVDSAGHNHLPTPGAIKLLGTPTRPRRSSTSTDCRNSTACGRRAELPIVQRGRVPRALGAGTRR